jgi:hypothetical protein
MAASTTSGGLCAINASIRTPTKSRHHADPAQ